MLVQVDRARCQGHGVCAVTAPDLFELDDSGLAAVHGDSQSPTALDGARAAEASCPELAITLVAP